MFLTLQLETPPLSFFGPNKGKKWTLVKINKPNRDITRLRIYVYVSIGVSEWMGYL